MASDAGRVLVALGGGGLVVGAGLLSMLLGPARLSVDTSKDGFLRRAGLDDALTRNYLHRFRERCAGSRPWVALPLAASGPCRCTGSRGGS